jgi:hypothetical protein
MTSQMLALSVSDTGDHGPDVAVVIATPDRLRQWLREIDMVRLLKQATAAADSRLFGFMFWDNSPYWLKGGELALELEGQIDGDGWVRLTAAQASDGRVEAAERNSDAQADAQRRFVDDGGVQWRAYPKWGSGQYETAELSRADLVQLLEDTQPTLGHFNPATLPLPDGELRVFEPDTSQGDLGPMYVLDVLGVSLLIRQRADGVYVHLDGDATSHAVSSTLLVEVNNGGESEHSL